MTKRSMLSLTCLGLLCAATQMAQAYEEMPANRDIQIGVANDAGARYGSGAADTYWLNAPGGGLNQLHISNTGAVSGLSGQVTTQTIASYQPVVRPPTSSTGITPSSSCTGRKSQARVSPQ